uniref:Glutathione S-transferase n=1 Tax=Oryza glumipatula TaxID=40148 RepID=A0A0E0B9J8_9ORYZ
MAGGDELKLLGTWPSPFVTRVELVLALKGLSHEYVTQDLVGKSDLLLASNPVYNKVPVLIRNGKPIYESRIILKYIDEAFPVDGATLLPADPYDRAVARFWAAYIGDKGKTEEEKAKGIKQILAAVETLEGALTKGCSWMSHWVCPYSGGEGDRGAHRCQDLRRRHYPPPGLVGGALRRA